MGVIGLGLSLVREHHADHPRVMHKRPDRRPPQLQQSVALCEPLAEINRGGIDASGLTSARRQNLF